MNHSIKSMERVRLFLYLVMAALLGGLFSVGIYRFVDTRSGGGPGYDSIQARQQEIGRILADTSSSRLPSSEQFRLASAVVRPAVVHIKTYGKVVERPQLPEGLEELHPFFGPQDEGQTDATGSGVIVSDDGYIVTNHHVIDRADKVEVVLDDKRSYKAQVIGSDPNSDLALLKIDESRLPFVSYGNSDQVKVGDWVLAVGNPFDLTSTVTAGIVSAKSRNISILRTRSNLAVESFIQTDAAVNPGNSGGALVNLRGELVGINTAIASNTGTFTGYSFAIPSSIVSKVIDDLLKYGEVQRGLLGVTVRDVDARLAEEKSLSEVKGVYVEEVNKNSAAAEAKLKRGDVILKINDREVNSTSEMIEMVARNRPGDLVNVTFRRGNEVMSVKARLKNPFGTRTIVKAEKESTPVKIDKLGAELRSLSASERNSLGIDFGIKVTSLKTDGELAQSGMSEGCVLQYADKKPLRTPADLERIVKSTKGGILLEGYNPDGRKTYYAFGVE